MRTKRIILACFLLLIFIAPIVCFVLMFHNHPFSDDSADWGNLGSYIGGIYSLLASVLVIYITRFLQRKDTRMKKRTEAAEALYQQIKKIDASNNQKSIEKLVRDIDQYEIYLPQHLIKSLKNLHDSFQQRHDNNASLDIPLKNRVLEQLKDIYNE